MFQVVFNPLCRFNVRFHFKCNRDVISHFNHVRRGSWVNAVAGHCPVSFHMVMANGSLKQLQEKYVKIWPLSNLYKNSQASTVNSQLSTKHTNKTCYLTKLKILKICNKLLPQLRQLCGIPQLQLEKTQCSRVQSSSPENGRLSAGQEIQTSFKTRKFITVSITARYWSVSWANWNQSTHLHSLFLSD